MLALRSGAVCLVIACALSAAWVSEAVRPIAGDANLRKRDPKAPQWPLSYKLSFTLSIPNLFHTQPGGLSYPVTLWHDETQHRQLVQVYNGIDTTLTLKHAEYTVYPRINVTVCETYNGDLTLASTLPDLGKFDFAGEVEITPGLRANIWQWQYMEGDRTSQYTMYVGLDGMPLKFYMTGFNYESDSHFDEYLYDFEPLQLLSAADADSVFKPPAVCTDKDAAPRSTRHPLAVQQAALLPGVRTTDPVNHAFALWSRANGRVHADEAEVQTRQARYQEVVSAVHAHNNLPGVTYKRAVTRFADWSNEEFTAVMLPKALQRSQEGASNVAAAGAAAPRQKSLLPGVGAPAKRGFTPQMQFVGDESLELPKSVDWRGTGLDVGVKDQAMCGSCFTFAAVAAMQSAWYLATGQRRSFSEQQLVDCSWDYGYNNGCFGGDYQPCIAYIAENGGIALEQEYQYEGVNNYCRATNHTRVGHFSGFVEIPHRHERAMMQALHELGPLAVGVDAQPESFRFYSEGVWSDPDCKTGSRELDHAVIAYGYGTTPEGVDYWLVQNTWSKLYGEDGYIKVARGTHDCGISTDPVSAVVAKAYVVPLMSQSKRAEAVRA